MNTYDIKIQQLEKVATKKLTFKGETKVFDVYKVPIDMLFYNDLNGRIATFISQYASEGKDITSLDNKTYNDTIAEFIKNSATLARFKKTKEDVRQNTQKEVGVVLTDGRVIDGNRRFTCLRELFDETGDQKCAYFEAVVLDAPSKTDEYAWKAIRSLELELQIGTDEKVDYSPIDWLVRVYRDVVKEKLFTEQEYCRLTKLSASEFRKTKTKAELMEDFLEFFNKPEQFYIAKKLELDGPLQELVKTRKRLNDREWDSIKVVFYVYLWKAKCGDKTRFVRKLANSVGTPDFATLITKAISDAEKILNGEEVTPESKPVKPTTIGQDGSYNPQLAKEVQSSLETQAQDVIAKKSNFDAKNKPIKCCEDALKNLGEIDQGLVDRWNDATMTSKYKRLLNDLERTIERLKNHVS